MVLEEGEQVIFFDILTKIDWLEAVYGQGDLLRGIYICSGAALKAVRQLLTTSLVIIFLYLNL